jgi:hypothetical protein
VPRGEETYRWVEITKYIVPAFKLTRMVNAIKTENVVAGFNGDVTVMQDINKERWLWGFKLRKVGNKHRVENANGHATTLEEAKAAAEEAMSKVSA